MSRDKVLLLGFDGLDFRYLDAFEDLLPNFSYLRRACVAGPLSSTFPPMTPSAWPSIYAGVDPSYHGVFDFLGFTEANAPSEKTVDRSDVKVPAIWNYLSAVDKPSIVMNVPMTYPLDSINGVIVPGFAAPRNAEGYPDGIMAELSKELERKYRIYPESDTVDEYIDTFEIRADASKYLLETYDWRFAFLQLQHTDSVFHYCDDERDFQRVLSAADDYLGEMLKYVDGKTHVLVCSDHGMGRTQGQTVYLNQLLHDAGYTKFESTRAEAEPGHSFLRTAQDAVRRVLTAGFEVAQRFGIEGQLLSVLPTDRLKTATQRPIDRQSSIAFCRNGTELGVRLNKETEGGEGIPPEEIKSIREELITYLTDLRTPDGSKAFEYVEPREAVFEGGPYMDNAPDIVLMPFTEGNTVSHEVFGPMFRPNDSYEHRPQGVFLGASPRFSELDQTKLSLPDIAPLVMSLLDLPIPKRMTGRPPDEFDLTVRKEPYPDVSFTSAGGTTDEGVSERLQDVGYL